MVKKCAPECEIMEDALDFQLAEHQNEETTHYELEEEDEMGYLIHVWGQVGRSVLRMYELEARELSALMLMLDASNEEGAGVQMYKYDARWIMHVTGKIQGTRGRLKKFTQHHRNVLGSTKMVGNVGWVAVWKSWSTVWLYCVRLLCCVGWFGR